MSSPQSWLLSSFHQPALLHSSPSPCPNSSTSSSFLTTPLLLPLSPPPPPPSPLYQPHPRPLFRSSELLPSWLSSTSSNFHAPLQLLQLRSAFPGGNRSRRKFPRLVASAGNGRTSEDDVEQPTLAIGSEVMKLVQKANAFLPHVVVASTLLALFFPPTFTWFTNRYYAPSLGFLMFAVGINLNSEDFINAFKRPGVIALGYIGQFVVKPLLGVMAAMVAVSYLNLPQAIGSGIILVSCVSGAQLSNYATFLVEPTMAPLSIVMTALSTATAVVVTPTLTLLLLGRRLPVDVQGMMVNITQIVVAPIAAGLALNKFAALFSKKIKPFLPLLSVLITGLCVGSPLAMNISTVRSPFGLTVLLPLLGFHCAAFVVGFWLAGLVFAKAPDLAALQKTISFETGMQSSLLGLALANKFFADPLVGVPPAISTVLMSLMGFGLVVLWSMEKKK